MFLKTHSPDILQDIANDLRLVTLRISCDYFDELYALDEIDIQMSLAHMRQHRIGLDFSFVKVSFGKDRMVARGYQEIGCMRTTNDGLVPTLPPLALANALKPYSIDPPKAAGTTHSDE
jgi:enediyne biosynthesis thioesterase